MKNIDKVKEAIKHKDKELLSEVYYSLEETDDGYFEVLIELCGAYWHDYHRDILLELQRLKNPRSIEVLYKVVLWSQDEQPIWIYHRAIWALADIGTNEAKEKLLKLSSCKHEYIASLAQKRLDEWENELRRKSFKVLEQGCYLTDEEDDIYTKELFIELIEEHPLYGKLERVVVHQDRVWDDVLCKHIGKDAYSMVHLTWRGEAEFAGYPSFCDYVYSWDEYMNL